MRKNSNMSVQTLMFDIEHKIAVSRVDDDTVLLRLTVRKFPAL